MLKLYNTLTRETEPVIPQDQDTFRFYCCGPTVYGPAHIGNFRTFLVQDLFRRVVELGGIKTKHVRNITDVDDKTIRTSIQEGSTLSAFTERWTQRFQSDAAALNMLEPHVEPSAVEHIQEQIDLTKILVKRGYAYPAEDGSVYFNISAFSKYGRLSRLDKREILEGASGRADSDEYEKESVSDFALWKGRKPEDGDNYWSSPWGDGRPGWHLECSAMAMKHLGNSFDLHSGGIDLCFPHHENEIAQSEAATGEVFARHWLHVIHLLVDGKKMSKSLGNLYTLSDLEMKGYDPREIRYAILTGHYRQPINFNFNGLNSAQKSLERIEKLITDLAHLANIKSLNTYEGYRTRGPSNLGPFQGCWDALENDLNTSAATGQLFSALRPIEKSIKAKSLDHETASELLEQIGFIVVAFGWQIKIEPPEETPEIIIPEAISALAQERWEAKASRDFAKADALRAELTEVGWTVLDTKDGFTLTPAK
ncbi:MAG: cysteine--tRNA ligase [Verrucomicrobiota bacterium]